MSTRRIVFEADDVPLDTAKIDEAVLALLHLNSSTELAGPYRVTRAWKSLSWNALNRLHEAGLISDPCSKAKSVVLTDAGVVQAKDACERVFGRSRAAEKA